MRIGIRQATKQGWIEMRVGGVADFSYPDSEFRRGRVQGGGVEYHPQSPQQEGYAK